jgi:hypothetical protein
LPISDVVVLPSEMSPAARMNRTTSLSAPGTKSANAADPNVVRTPAVIVRSLMAVGTPCSGPRPSAGTASSAFACARASSAVTVTNAPTSPPYAAIRSR